jgi:hypothetical protein
VSMPGQLRQLLVVHERRVRRAMHEVQSRNEALRQRELERDAVRARGLDAKDAYGREQRRYLAMIAGKPAHTVSAGGLTVIVRRCEWHRARADELHNLLRTAEALVSAARAAAGEARRGYLRLLARSEALQMVASQWQSARTERNSSLGEEAAQELSAHRHAEMSAR